MSIDKVGGIGGNVTVPAPAAQPAAAEAVERPQQVVATAAPVSAEQSARIERVAKQLESYVQSVSRSLEFRVDAASGRTVVSVRDATTGELIRQIPSEEVLHFAQMAEDQTIVLVDAKV